MRPIDADVLVESIEELKRSPWYNGENGNYERLVRSYAIGTVVDLCIKAAPTLDYAPVRHGEWIPVDGETPCDEWACTACGKRKTYVYSMYYDEIKELYSFCPNCGALMDGGKKDEETRRS